MKLQPIDDNNMAEYYKARLLAEIKVNLELRKQIKQLKGE